MKFDLHVHTNHSDGLFSPEKIVDLAVDQNLNGIAITDHDTTTGIEFAINHSKRYKNFEVIPGIEISCVYNDNEVHILGYFIDYNNKDIITITNKLKSSRLTRGIEIVNKINQLGLDISLEEVKEFSGEEYIGRPHIARVMVKKDYVTDIQDAFNKYLDRGKPAYVERYKISIKETISLIKNAGGIAVLAHPGLLKDKNIIDYCISLGIDGLECIHSKHSKSVVENLSIIARANNLIITGGSDFHGDLINGEIILGKYFINLQNILEMKERM
ncbi:PHP domain-containing protein [Tissierella sp.]|uniref:PHP domain-containing protein n=1 Tax=Tissierella sp. TaxID=41274 RepID=UPI00285EC366|nr:PHP domain-containing protein [Tissierella sp.]MDR7856204.1 PHP domain-containing protein [Tissierella sp.]